MWWWPLVSTRLPGTQLPGAGKGPRDGLACREPPPPLDTRPQGKCVLRSSSRAWCAGYTRSPRTAHWLRNTEAPRGRGCPGPHGPGWVCSCLAPHPLCQLQEDSADITPSSSEKTVSALVQPNRYFLRSHGVQRQKPSRPREPQCPPCSGSEQLAAEAVRQHGRHALVESSTQAAAPSPGVW